MIPYFLTTGTNKISCNADLVIMDGSTPIMISLCDINIKNRKICADLISNSYNSMSLRDRENTFFEKNISSWGDNKFRYKSERMANDLTHTIIYSAKINDYCINWNNEDKVELITKYLRNIHFMPVTNDIVEKVLSQEEKYYSCIKEIEVYVNNPKYADLKAYQINVTYFKQKLNSTKIDGFEDSFDWSEIKDIEDYIFIFLDPIKHKLSKSIKTLYNPNNINPKMFEGDIKPFKGQIPIIQGAIEVLKRNRFVYLACEQGLGKTTMSVKINHCVLHPKNYVTLIVAPAITLSQWEKEIRSSISDDVDIHIIRKTNEFINIYNKTNLKFDKPQIFIVGKETFKLDSKKISGVNIRTRLVKFKKVVESRWYSDVREVKEKITIACCPDCFIPLRNQLRKTEDVFFTEKDFQGTPKKSNYKCSECGAVLWQSSYDKTKKSSLIRFIKTKNIQFDSIICDEIHEQNNGESIIGNATRTLFGHSIKQILLSGTSNNGYSSSLHNLLVGLLPNKLKKNEVMDIKQFIQTYGTLMAVSKRKDGDYFSSGRSQIKDSEFKEIEGINPIVFSKYLVENYIFGALEDLGKDLPKLKETYVPITQSDEMERNGDKLFEDIKSKNAFNAKMYIDSVIKHYVNNPFSWNTIPIEKEGIVYDIQPTCIDNVILPKEIKLLEIIKQEVSEGRKCCVFVDFTGGGEYMKNSTIAKRLEQMLIDNGISVFTLKSSVATYDRKDLLDKKKDEFQVLISNRKLLNVGLNLVYIPTYINYMPSYMVNEVSQANRRGYRANSTLENRIYNLYYENSCEKGIILRYERKLVESAAIRGIFNVEIEKDDTIRTASKLGLKISGGINKI